MNETKLLSDALKVLKIENCTAFDCSSDINLKTKDGLELKCFIPVAAYIGKLSARDGFIGHTKEEQAGVYQWLEYCLLHSNSKDKEMLLDLNKYLKDKVYFVGNRFTIADLLLYLSLHEVYSKMSFQEKESYCNVSRWFRLSILQATFQGFLVEFTNLSGREILQMNISVHSFIFIILRVIVHDI